MKRSVKRWPVLLAALLAVVAVIGLGSRALYRRSTQSRLPPSPAKPAAPAPASPTAPAPPPMPAESAPGHAPAWPGGWRGRIVRLEKAASNEACIDAVSLSRDRKLLSTVSGGVLRVYSLNAGLGVKRLVYSTDRPTFVVRGATVVKGGVVYWGVAGRDSRRDYDGSGTGDVVHGGRLCRWDAASRRTRVLRNEILTNAAATPDGTRVLLFGSGLRSRQSPNTYPDGRTHYHGKAELYDVRRDTFSPIGWVEAWRAYGPMGEGELGQPSVVGWSPDASHAYLVCDIRYATGAGWGDIDAGPVLMSLSVTCELLPLTALRAHTFVAETRPTVIASDGRIACVVRAKGTVQAEYFDRAGLSSIGRALEGEGGLGVWALTFTPDGAGLIFCPDTHPPGTAGKDELWARNLTTGKYYRLAGVGESERTTAQPAGGWVDDTHFAFTIARGRGSIPAILVVEPQADAVPSPAPDRAMQ